ncbi:MAG: hypothetical protein IMZ52_09585 [Actinobacteria bacterium]|nr:hypothetical protein [Bacteroidota bacterium]MBE3095269.1 hypothetical protein [Actinomycetota bacterium]
MKEEEGRNKPEDKQMEKKPMYVLKEEMFVGKSIYESYNYYHHTISKSSKEEYFRLCRTIEFGKELLPTDVKKEDIKKMNALYEAACSILETETMECPTQTFGWGDPASKTHPIYTMKADDGGNISCLQEQYGEAMNFFIETQYAQHIKNLREIDNRIFNFLAKYEIISKKPSVDDLMEEQFKEELLSDMMKERDATNIKKAVEKNGIEP